MKRVIKISIIARSPILYSALSTFVIIIATLFILDPIWTNLNLHVPGKQEIIVNFTQPVDTYFYIQNAINGFQWATKDPTSLWFHPLLSWILDISSSINIPLNYQFWILSLISGFLSLVVITKYIREISPIALPPWLLLFAILIPGAIGIGTGNAEIPCLLFNSILILTTINSSHYLLPFVFGVLATLAKPNAIYMLLPLSVYAASGLLTKDRKLVVKSCLGIIGILATFTLWTVFVDYRSGNIGTYWEIRNLGNTVPSIFGPIHFFNNLAYSFLVPNNYHMQLRYLFAILVPIVNMWLLQCVPFRDTSHRTAIFFGNIAVLTITLLINNPNKVLLYSTTLPGHFVTNILFLQFLFCSRKIGPQPLTSGRRLAGVAYFLYCIATLLFYIFGTPLEWYY